MKSARQEILDKLSKIKHALPDSPDLITPVYFSIEEPLELAFKKNLEKVNGNVHLLSSEKELIKSLKEFLSKYKTENICCRETEIQQLFKKNKIQFLDCSELPEEIEIGITGCEFLIAQTGSVLVSSAQKGGRQLFVYPPVHIVFARKKQLVETLEQAYSEILKKHTSNLPSQITLITGPSRTADIEKTLILGAHGPKEFHVFLY